MASRKQFELLFQLKATYGNNFVKTFSNAAKTMKDMQGGISRINSLQKDISGYKRQQAALETNRTKLSGLAAQHEKLAEKIKRGEDREKALKEAIEKTGDATGELTAELNATDRELEANREKLSSNETRQKSLTGTITQQIEKLEGMSEELRKAGVNTDSLDASTERLQRQYERLQQSQERIGDLSGKIEKNNQKIAETKSELKGTIGAAAAVGAALYAGPVKKAAEFEEQMSRAFSRRCQRGTYNRQ